jgi:hypothetical protein
VNLTVYEVAVANNNAKSPARTNLTSVKALLPDLRDYLLVFDHQDAFQPGSYSQFSWSAAALFVAAAVFALLLFISHIVWTVCCFSCGCRKRDPAKRQKIYAKYQKILWGVSMVICFAVATASAVWTFLVVHSDISPISTEVIAIINGSLIANISKFESAFLTPLDKMVTEGYQDFMGHQIWLEDLQEAAVNDLLNHTFLENQSYTHDVVSEPVVAIVDSLLEYSLLYPTAVDNTTDCANMNITPSVVSRMTVGGSSSCFKCKTCAAIAGVVEATVDYWRRHPFQIQMDMLTSQRHLQDFGEAKASLAPAIREFLDRTHASISDSKAQIQRIATKFDRIATHTWQVTTFALFALLGLGGATLLFGVCSFAHGIVTNKRTLPRSTCCVAELTVLLAFVLTGVLYAIVWMAHDCITAIQLLDDDVLTFASSTNSAEVLQLILFDKNLIEASGLNATLAFSDTLRVPPLPTPYDDDPDRVNITDLYSLSTLFTLEEATEDTSTALISLFGWSEEFVDLHREFLMTLAFGNSSVQSKSC